MEALEANDKETGNSDSQAVNGWLKVAYAKAGSGIAFAMELFAMLFIGSVAAQMFYLGTSGWDMPIQNIKITAVAPMNMLQAEIYEYAYLFLGMIGYAGLVMLISASVKSNVRALLLSFAAVYAPMMIAEYLPYGVPVLTGIVCMPFAVKKWSRRIKE